MNASEENDSQGFRYLDTAHRKPEIGYFASADVQQTEKFPETVINASGEM
jgi:hypothetical protein